MITMTEHRIYDCYEQNISGVGSIALAVPLPGVFRLLYPTVKGSRTWYFRVNGQVLVDGRQSLGYMHANVDRTIRLIPVMGGGNPEEARRSEVRGLRSTGHKSPTMIKPCASRS